MSRSPGGWADPQGPPDHPATGLKLGIRYPDSAAGAATKRDIGYHDGSFCYREGSPPAGVTLPQALGGAGLLRGPATQACSGQGEEADGDGGGGQADELGAVDALGEHAAGEQDRARRVEGGDDGDDGEVPEGRVRVVAADAVAPPATFDADAPHVYRSSGTGTCSLIMTVHLPPGPA